MPVDGIYSVHFQDVCLWSNALLFSTQQIKVKSVIDAVHSKNLLDLADIEVLLQSHAHLYLCGFLKDIDVPDLTALHELLRENWIGECILNACAHQVEIAVNSNVFPGDHMILRMLPAIFHSQLTVAY